MAWHTFLSDYGRAIRVASRGRPAGYWAAARSVLRARFGHQLGPRYHALFDLATVPESAWDDYLLSRDVNPLTMGLNARHDLELAKDKLAFTAHCRAQGLATIPILAVLPLRDAPLPEMDGFPVARDAGALATALATHGPQGAAGPLFFKLIDGASGVGAFVAEPAGGQAGGQWRFAGQVGDTAQLFDFCRAQRGDASGWLVQPVVRAHPQLRALMPSGSLGTVRAVTYLDGEKACILLPLLKLPVGGNCVDTFDEGLSGNLVVPIDLDTGVLGLARRSTSRRWPEIETRETHPDNGQRITGTRLPDWPACVALMLTAQRRTPMLKTLGWDVALTADGPLIVETNTGYGVEILEVAYGRGVRADLAPILAMAAR